MTLKQAILGPRTPGPAGGDGGPGLRGPVQGEDEEVPGRIRDRYLVGILAPRQRAEGEAPPLFDRPAAPTAEDDDLEADLPPGEDMAVEGSGRGNLGGDDGPIERTPPLSKVSFPRRWGCPSASRWDVNALKVTPRWGRYYKAPLASRPTPRPGRLNGSGSVSPAARPTKSRSRPGRSARSSPTRRSPTPRSGG